MTAVATPMPAGGRATQRAVLTFVSTAHFFSHFNTLLLPPLFPILVGVYGLGFTELGFAVALASLSTMLTEAPVGMLVDRYGARVPLIVGLVLECAAIGAVALFPSYEALLACMVVIGLANSVFHPANYSVLDASMDDARMGRAFSIHTFGGYLGTAMGPATVVYLTSLMGWQGALLICAGVGVSFAAILARFSKLLINVREEKVERARGKNGLHAALALLFSAPILLGMLFFATLSMAEYGIVDFGVSAFMLTQHVPITTATIALSVYLFASPAGVLTGGWLADRVKRHHWLAATCMSLFAACILCTAIGGLPWTVVVGLVALAGFSAGMVAPSRDLLIRRITPPGDTGKVFGFVMSGFHVGGLVAPPLFGFVLDQAEPHYLFLIAGMMAVVAAGIGLLTGRGGSRRRVVGRAS